MGTGVWLVGARGSVAVTSHGRRARAAGRAHGADGLRHGAARTERTGAARLADLVFGGHDLATTPLVKKAEALADSGVLPARLVGRASPTTWPTSNAGSVPVPVAARQADVVAALVDDLVQFREQHRLDRVVVVNVSSTEPGAVGHPAHASLGRAGGRPGRRRARCCRPARPTRTPPFRAGCPYVDFTPSTGARLPALAELAETRRAAVRGARRQDRRDAGEIGAGADVRRRGTCGCTPGPGSTCSAAATARTSPTRPPTRRRRPASSGCSPRPSATCRRARAASSTSRTSATSRPRGT